VFLQLAINHQVERLVLDFLGANDPLASMTKTGGISLTVWLHDFSRGRAFTEPNASATTDPTLHESLKRQR
jgi:hypothetical protein